MKKPTRLWPHEQAVLFQFVVEGRLPEWAKDDPRKVLARLLNKTEKWANAAYERAKHAGYLDRV